MEVTGCSPIWHGGQVATIGTFLVVGLFWIGREVFEKLGYNIAASSQIGDIFLLGIIFIETAILQRNPELPPWVTGPLLHTTCIIAALIISFLTSKLNAQMIMDRFHNDIVVPVFFYFLVTAAPVIWFGGQHGEFAWALVFLLIWFGLCVFDFITDRLNQQMYLNMHYGIKLPVWEGMKLTYMRDRTDA
jgi:hypothetical protein